MNDFGVYTLILMEQFVIWSKKKTDSISQSTWDNWHWALEQHYCFHTQRTNQPLTWRN